MGDDHGSSNIGYMLDALVVIVLVGTVIIYGNPSDLHASSPQSADVARLAP